MTRRKLFIGLFAVVVAATVWWSHLIISYKFIEPTHRADRLFKPYGEEIYGIAQRIERGKVIGVAEVKALSGGINNRYGEDITLLFHALGSHNIEAIDALLAAGADPYVIDTPSKGSTRTFVYYLILAGHPTNPQSGFKFINQLIELYLKHGGDPKYRLGGANNDSLIAGVALMDNYEGIDLLLEAGADPWSESGNGDTAMSLLAADGRSQKVLIRLIDDGYFDDVPVPQLQKFMQAVAGYLPRGDEISLANQNIGRRVLNRNPEYPEDRHTERLFQGPIPWAEIENE